MRSKLKLKGKFIAVVITIFILLAGVINWRVHSEVTSLITDITLTSNAELSYKMLDLKYSGNWNMKDGQLHKGDVLIEGKSEIIDEIKELTGLEATIFAGDKRVSTTIVENGKRVIGTRAHDKISDLVMEDGKPHMGEAEVAGEDYYTIYIPMKDASNKIIGMYFVGVASEIIHEEVSNSAFTILMVIDIVCIFAVAIIWIMISVITKRIKRINKTISEIAKGDLTRRCIEDSNDEITEIASSVNHMANEIENLIDRIKNTAEIVNDSTEVLGAATSDTAETSSDISQSVEIISRKVEDQNAEIIKVVDRNHELSEIINEVSNSAENMKKVAGMVEEESENGVKSLESLLEKTEERDISSVKVGKAVAEMSDIVDKVSNITEVIGAIASQTNLLALNASIEASRAGEHGRGFAVVADEVRNLAEQSSVAAVEIKELIESIKEKTSEVVSNMSEAKDAGKDQSEAVEGAKNVFLKLSKEIDKLYADVADIEAQTEVMEDKKNRILKRVDSIASSSEEISGGTQEIFAAVEEQLATIEEISAKAQNLSALSEELKTASDKFKTS